MISAIVAVDNNWGIGYNGDLLEHIPEDLKYFKELTTNHVIIMGRKTWDSLPNKPLKDRLNVVISHSLPRFLGPMAFSISMREAQVRMQDDETEYFVIGGGSIYEQLLPFCNRIYVTKIYKDYDSVDTYFPNLDELDNWQVSECSDIKQYKDISYQFLTYDRIS